MTIHISPDVSDRLPEINYLLKILAINCQETIAVTVSNDKSAPVIGRNPESTVQTSDNFGIRKVPLDYQFNNAGIIELEGGVPDYLSTAFLYLTAVQEHNDPDPDGLGRFKYKNSLQAKFRNVEKNLVQHCFDQLVPKLGLKKERRPSSFFLSHDIDTVNGAILEDGFHVLKRGRIDLFLKLLFNVALSKPDWLNIDEIMKLESLHDCRSVFYWIVNKGNIDRIQKNADYDFSDSRIQQLKSLVASRNFENGLHKSLAQDSFREEIQKFGSFPVGNRFHYLKFSLPKAFHDLDEAGLKLDSSLGFSERWGFRNNYGLPFNPFNFEARCPFKFVEVPLHIMDRTFFSQRLDIGAVEKHIMDFFDAHRQDCVLSVLWHNNFFTGYKYKGYLSVYKKILAYIRDNSFKTVSQDEIIKNYGISWP
jgi:hypothetical protein